MTDYPIRLYADDAAVRRIGAGLLDLTLPRADWTHEAHFAACHWLLTERPDIDIDRDLRGIISAYNESVGGVNDDTQGYHETITCCFVLAVRLHLATIATPHPLVARVNALLVSPYARREWPLGYYSREHLLSVAARRDFVGPDLAALPTVGIA
jgi:hypothetical protein